MDSLLEHAPFMTALSRLAAVTLNPRRHTAPNALAHSRAVASMAARLGAANGCSADEIARLTNLGHAHDIGKSTGSARPAKSLDVLVECGVTDPVLLALVKVHDTNLPWYQSSERGEAPSDKAWRKLANAIVMRLLCLFMVADRVDAPGGWRRNAPVTWFIAQARARGLVGELVLDLDDHPSEICAGAALVRSSAEVAEVLVTRVRSAGFELPKGGIEWDELPCDAAVRELREETGVEGELSVGRSLGQLDYVVGSGADRHAKRVHYCSVSSVGAPRFGMRPARTHELRWLRKQDIDGVPLVNEGLRAVLYAALDGKDGHE